MKESSNQNSKLYLLNPQSLKPTMLPENKLKKDDKLSAI